MAVRINLLHPPRRTNLYSRKNLQGPLYRAANEARRQFAEACVSQCLVGAAATTTLYRIVSGANKEALRDGYSTHAEAAMVSDLMLDERLLRILIVGGKFLRDRTARTPLAPCGNCRNVLMSFSAQDAEILLRMEGGIDRWTPVSDLLPQVYDEKKPLSKLDTQSHEYHMFHSALTLLRNKPFIPLARDLHAAAVLTSEGMIFCATQIDDPAFFHTLPAEGALVMADCARQRKIQKILFLSRADDPNVPKFPDGRSLQKIQLASQLAGIDMPVIAVTIKDVSSLDAALRDGRIYYSKVSRLLPFASNLDLDISPFV